MTRKEENPWCYIGRRSSCGCIVAAAVDIPEDRKGTAKFVKKLIDDGLTIDRMRVVDVRNLFGCEHEKTKDLPSQTEIDEMIPPDPNIPEVLP